MRQHDLPARSAATKLRLSTGAALAHVYTCFMPGSLKSTPVMSPTRSPSPGTSPRYLCQRERERARASEMGLSVVRDGRRARRRARPETAAYFETAKIEKGSTSCGSSPMTAGVSIAAASAFSSSSTTVRWKYSRALRMTHAPSRWPHAGRVACTSGQTIRTAHGARHAPSSRHRPSSASAPISVSAHR